MRAENPDGTAATASYATIAGAERPLEVRDALGNERSSSFDILGNETSSSDARGNQTQRQFDDLRRVVRSVDALGHAAESDFDAVPDEAGGCAAGSPAEKNSESEIV